MCSYKKDRQRRGEEIRTCIFILPNGHLYSGRDTRPVPSHFQIIPDEGKWIGWMSVSCRIERESPFREKLLSCCLTTYNWMWGTSTHRFTRCWFGSGWARKRQLGTTMTKNNSQISNGRTFGAYSWTIGTKRKQLPLDELYWFLLYWFCCCWGLS